MTSSFYCAINNPATSNSIGMAVEPYPADMATPDGPDYVDLYTTQTSSYSTTNDPNTSSYTWTVTPENAWDELTVDMFNLSVTWTESYTGQAHIEVFGTNNCGDGLPSDAYEVSIGNTFGIGENDLNVGVAVFPNPNNGTFTVKLSSESNESVKLSIRSIVGESIFNEELITVNGELVKTFDLSNFAEGIYFLILENNNKVLTEKIVVQK